MFDFKNEVLIADQRIRKHVKYTPLEHSVGFTRKSGANVYFKCENLQHTGSFKLRGAMNKLLGLYNSQSKKSVVAASTGNHGAAVAFCLNQLNMEGAIFVPENIAQTKIQNIANYTNNIQYYGLDSLKTEVHALNYAKEHDKIYISPYNDRDIITGQGTIGLEIASQLDNVDAVFVPIGGGGLISGIAGYLKTVNPNIKIIGCLPKNSPVMYESIKAGKVIEMETLPTLSDGTSGGLELHSITFDLCRKFVDEYVIVSEEDIKNAMIDVIKIQHSLIEGAAAVALASFLKISNKLKGKNVVIVLSGGNIDYATLQSIICI